MKLVIHLTTDEDCWVLLTEHSDGLQIYRGVIPAGSSMTWTENQAVEMRLGNPVGVIVTVNGKLQSTNISNPETLSFGLHSG